MSGGSGTNTSGAVNRPAIGQPALPEGEYTRAQVKIDFKRELGKGNFANVYYGSLSRTAGNQMEAAFKVPKKDDEETKVNIREEFEAGFQLNGGANILQTIGITTGPKPCLIMEYVFKAKDMKHVLCQDPSLSNESKALYVTQAIDGLLWIHSKGFVHRDFAARNFLVPCHTDPPGYGALRVSDFGLAKRMNAAGNYIAKENEKFPVKWSPPESISDERRFSVDSDKWSLGVVFWEFFSGNPLAEPYGCVDDGKELLRSLLEGDRLMFGKTCPKVIVQVAKELWELEPHKRLDLLVVRGRIQQALVRKELDDQSASYDSFDEDAPPPKEELDITVVGSVGVELKSYAARADGSKKSEKDVGFKGANQAVMAARLGAKTAIIAKHGESLPSDDPVAVIQQRFRDSKIDAEHLGEQKGAVTGSVSIVVDKVGGHEMDTKLGANMDLSIEDVRKGESKISESKVLVTQLEIRHEVALEAMKLAKNHGDVTIFNPTVGVVSALPDDEHFKQTDILCVNQDAASWLAGKPLKSDDDFAQALKTFLDRGAKAAIITLGEKGCVFATDEKPTPVRVNAKKVEVVDSTGAGDAFVGALAFFTARYPIMTMEQRVRRSCRIATITVQSQGTQSSYPTRQQLPTDFFE